MIATVTLNPCRDHTAVIPEYNRGGLNRVIRSRQDMCGKGINTGIVLKNLGFDVTCLGFDFTDGKAELADTLNRMGIPHEFVTCPGKIRTNIKIFEESTGTMTELNEYGDHVDAERERILIETVRRHACKMSVITLAGGIPQGINPDIYRRLAEAARESNPDVVIVLDADGDLLAEGIKAAPDIIKPNLYELGNLCGCRIETTEDILDRCREIHEQGVKMICVSMGADGALISDGREAFFSPALDIKVRGVQGAGDSMVAGLCMGCIKKEPLSVMLRNAVAAAGGSLTHEGTLLCTREDFDELFSRVEIVRLKPVS